MLGSTPVPLQVRVKELPAVTEVEVGFSVISAEKVYYGVSLVSCACSKHIEVLLSIFCKFEGHRCYCLNYAILCLKLRSLQQKHKIKE